MIEIISAILFFLCSVMIYLISLHIQHFMWYPFAIGMMCEVTAMLYQLPIMHLLCAIFTLTGFVMLFVDARRI